MRKIGIALAVAVAVMATTASTRSAKADGGTTTAIIAGVVAVASLKCVDFEKNEHLCILAPFNSQFCGFFKCPTDKNGKVITPKKTAQILPKNILLAKAAVTVVAAVKANRPDLKFPKEFAAKPAKEEKTKVAQIINVH